VEGEILVEGEIHTLIKTISVDIDQLVPLELKQSNARADPLTLGYEPHMPRAPDFDYVEHTYAQMLSALQSTTAMLASAFAAGVKKMLDVVYIPEGGPEKGQGTVQCRVKTPIARNMMRLYPYGGEFVPLKDGTTRSQIERRFNVKSCYMRGVQVSAKVSKTSR